MKNKVKTIFSIFACFVLIFVFAFPAFAAESRSIVPGGANAYTSFAPLVCSFRNGSDRSYGNILLVGGPGVFDNTVINTSSFSTGRITVGPGVYDRDSERITSNVVFDNASFGSSSYYTDLTIGMSDFYISINSNDVNDYTNLGFLFKNDSLFDDSDLIWSCSIKYCEAGTTDFSVFTWNYVDYEDGGPGPGTLFLKDSIGSGIFYVENFSMTLSGVLTHSSPSVSLTVLSSSFEAYADIDPRLYDLQQSIYDRDGGIDDNYFADMTSWLATAVDGFLDFDILPGFSIGGLVLVILSFSFVMYFLKLFAGG